jgi:hypothetical protein
VYLKVELCRVELPSGMSSVEQARFTPLFQILVVGEDGNGLGCTF